MPAAATIGLVHEAKPGPWGEVEYSRIVIEPPDEFMAADYDAAPSRWNFDGYDAAKLDQLWLQASLTADQLRALRDPAIRETSPRGIVVRPPDSLVASLSTESRAVIYNTLAGLPENQLQTEPFRFRDEMLEEWFSHSNVDPAIVDRIRQLLYRRGNAMLFSDPGLVLPHVPTAAGRVHLIKTLARKSTLLVKLRVRPGSDIESIAAYWSSNGRRRKDVTSLLHSLARQPEGMTLDIVHLLPRFARGLLYTYPSPEIPPELSPDCHWTAMNFFNDVPDHRFDDISYLRDVLLTTYSPVTGSPVMGDLLLMTRADGEVVHTSVYIADEIVFTKNGRSPSIPWTLTTLPDLQAFYPANPPLELRTFRRKN